MDRRRERMLRDHVVGGTIVTTETKLAKLTHSEAGGHALAIATVPMLARLETRHMAIVGTTGSGKTTVLRQMLDGIEARGEAALVYDTRSEEHTSELQSLMRISYAVFCLQKQTHHNNSYHRSEDHRS